MRFYNISRVFLFLSVFSSSIFAQEALKSTEEEYYDFLSLTGAAERPTLNYRTLSDSEWQVTDEKHLWKDNNLGTKRTLYESDSTETNWFTAGIDRSVKLKLYGPEWFNSYNTKAPYGQNDGALWQGKGYNTSLTAGARLEAFGFEATFKPQVSWSQNREFDYIMPNYPAKDKDGNSTIYNDKASKYGYYGVQSIDVPQRFGNSSFFTYDWGDTEIRYSWKNFTAGFGTQTIWLGPAQLNPIIHSNNASSYPKFDIGLRKTSVYMPHFGWYLGDFEGRGWWGKLSESDYFDNDDSNDSNLISGLAIAWKLPFSNLTVGLNRTMLSKWNDKCVYSLTNIYIPFDNNGGNDDSDQRFSFTADWLFEAVGLEIYLEWGRNDYSPSLNYIIRYPFHTQGWTAGIRKIFSLSNNNFIELLFECTNLESSRDYSLLWPTTFYAHHIITQGYTNNGQWLGAGIGTGGNSQYLGLKFRTQKSTYTTFIQRRNHDLDYTWYLDDNSDNRTETSIRASLDYGIAALFFANQSLKLNTTFIINRNFNATNNDNDKNANSLNFNFVYQFGIKYNF